MNANYITAMIALIVLLFVLLICMSVALALITKLRTRVDDLEANLDTKLSPAAQVSDANDQTRTCTMPLSPVRPFSPTRPIADYVSPRVNQSQIRLKRDRRSLESFRWVPFEGQVEHPNAYFNKIEDFKSTFSVQFNTLQRSKASIDLV